MRIETKKRKKAITGFRQMAGEKQAREALYRVIANGKQALDDLFMDMGRIRAESIMLMEREELAGPDYHPTIGRLKK